MRMTKAQGTSAGAANALTVVGVVLVAAFFAPWIDLNGQLTFSGWWLANHDATKLFVVPVLGMALVAAAATRSKYLPLVAALASLAIVGTTAYHTVRSVLHFEYGTLLTLLGGALALAGISDKRRGLRALGGALALAGFFLPWGDGHSAWAILRSDEADLAREMGVTMNALWAIPAGALLALASTAKETKGGALAGVGGALVLGGFFWFLGSMVNLVAGWGAWTTLGGGVAAGVLALVAAAAGGSSAPAKA
jgi:hypothetical protein